MRVTEVYVTCASIYTSDSLVHEGVLCNSQVYGLCVCVCVDQGEHESLCVYKSVLQKVIL